MGRSTHRTRHRLLVTLCASIWLAGCGRSLETLAGQIQKDIEAGEFPKATAAAKAARTEAVQRGDQAAEWRFRLQLAYVLLFKPAPKEALDLLEGPIPDSPKFAAIAAERALLQSRAHSLLKHPEQSQALLDQASRLAAAARAANVIVEVETIRGMRLDNQGHTAESDALLLRACERARKARLPYQEATILVDLGMNRLNRSRYDEAAGYFEDASRIAGPERSILHSVAQHNLAGCYSRLGETGRAIEIELKVVERLKKSNANAYLASALGELGHEYSLKGDLHRATSYLEEAVSLALKISSPVRAAIWASNLSNVYLGLGDLDRAEALNNQSRQLRVENKTPLLHFNDLNAGLIAAARGNRSEAERYFAAAMSGGKEVASISWVAQESLGSLALKQKRFPDALRHFEQAVAVVERERSNLNRTEFKLPFLTRPIRLYRLYVDTLLRQGQVEKALAVADSSRAQVVAQRSGAGLVRRLPAGAFQQIARDSGAVLLSYWLGPERSHAWVVTPGEVRHIELPAQSEIEALVAQYQDAIENRLLDTAANRHPAGERLFATLIEPVRKWIPPGSNVLVTLDGALHGLNLESLPVPGPTPRYWVEDVTVSLAPSLALLAQHTTAAGPRRLLLIGNPVSPGKDVQPLSHAAREMAAVSSHFGAGNSLVIDGPRARVAAFKDSSPGTFSAVHFTAHAIANRESPLDSAVLLSDGKLYARDVMSTPLSADLVTLSACRGAGLRLYSGEGLVGFAWAFLHAGARNVIAGLWDVDDDSTARLMDVLYRELASGKNPAAALHAAKLSLVTGGGNMRKPYYWAPFQVYTVAP